MIDWSRAEEPRETMMSDPFERDDNDGHDPMAADNECQECGVEGYIYEDVGGGNARKFRCERCSGKVKVWKDEE